MNAQWKIDAAEAARLTVLNSPRAREMAEQEPELAKVLEHGIAAVVPDKDDDKPEIECTLNEPALEGMATVPPPGDDDAPSGHTHATPKPEPELLFRLASEIEAMPVDWLWEDRIPFGMVTIVEGEPGDGKSTVAIDIAARVTRGDVMPTGGSWSNGGRPGNVILFMLEDPEAEVIKPRLQAAKADQARVMIIDSVGVPGGDVDDRRPPAFPADLKLLRRLIVEHEARFVVIDPLFAYLDAKTDSHRDQDIRRVLGPLGRIANDTGAAIVIIRHWKKSPGSAKHRGGGSIGITASARMGLLLGPDPADPTARCLAVFKVNVAPDNMPVLRLRLMGVEVPTATGKPAKVARVQWEGVAEGVTPDQLANKAFERPEAGAEDKAEPGKVDKVADALRDLLSAGPVDGAKAQKEVMADLECAEVTVRRACKKLRIDKQRRTGKGGRFAGWDWRLPDVQALNDH